jgi:hypothetical protein
MSCALREGLDSSFVLLNSKYPWHLDSSIILYSEFTFRIAHRSGERTHMSTDVSIQVLGLLGLPNVTLLAPHPQPSVQMYTLERLQCGD